MLYSKQSQTHKCKPWLRDMRFTAAIPHKRTVILITGTYTGEHDTQTSNEFLGFGKTTDVSTVVQGHFYHASYASYAVIMSVHHKWEIYKDG